MDPTQIILIVFIVLLIIIYPIIISVRNKKENQKVQEQTNSLKRGDKVLTTSGVYGTIVDLRQEGDKRIVTIETGSGKQTGYISVDAFAIYTVLRDEPTETLSTVDTFKAPEKEVAAQKDVPTTEVADSQESTVTLSTEPKKSRAKKKDA